MAGRIFLARGCFGYSPRDTLALHHFLLAAHRGVESLVQDRIRIALHPERWHQVLKHRPAPGEQDLLSLPEDVRPPYMKPAFLRHVALGNGGESGRSRFGCQQLVATRFQTPRSDVIADGQDLPALVVEEPKVHLTDQPVRL